MSASAAQCSIVFRLPPYIHDNCDLPLKK